MDKILLNGNASSIANNAIEASILTDDIILANPFISKKMAVPPKTDIQKNESSVGNNMTPKINSLTVRPLEILAPKFHVHFLLA